MSSSHKIATQEDLVTDLAVNHRNRIFNVLSFSYRSCVECNPEEDFFELPAIATKMNAKIETKNEYLRKAFLSNRKCSYEDFLKQLDGIATNQVLIEPFDFCSVKPSRATVVELNKANDSSETMNCNFAFLTSVLKIRFLYRIASLDFESDTTLAFDTILLG